MEHFGFRVQTNLSFGPNAVDALFSFLEEQGYKTVSVFIDRNVESTSHWQATVSKIRAQATIDIYYQNDEMEPTYDFLEVVRGEFNEKTDCIIAVGGGSTLDAAKAISVLITNTKPAIEYRGHGLIEKQGIPLVLIPTTAGTGSEITPFAVFTDTSQKRKFGINSPLYLPKLTIIDPIFTLSCPKSVTIASGMDALTHTLESYVARKHTPISRFFSKEAFRLLFNNLPKVVEDPENIDLRSQVSLGAYYAGIALFNAAAGPAGGLSYPIGTLFKVTHGMAGSVFLYPVVEFNVKGGYKEYDQLYDLIDPALRVEAPGGDKNESFLASFKSLVERFEIPTTLTGYGATRDDIPEILDQVKWLWGAVEQNPVTMTEQDILDILERML